MIRKEFAKKLGMALLAAQLAAPLTVPVVCAADAPASQAMGKEQDVQASDVPGKAPDEGESLKITTKTYEKEYKTDEGRIYKRISFEYPVAQGDSDAAQAFNKFYKNLRSKWKKEAIKDLEEAREIVQQFEDTSRFYYDEVVCEITSKDENYISVLQSGYDYQMGAHGMPYRYTYVFDAKTGKKVSAASLLGMSKSQLNKKVRSLYLKKVDKAQESEGYLFDSDRDAVKTVLDGIDFNQNSYYLKNGKVRFYVGPYAIAVYAAGFIEVAVKL